MANALLRAALIINLALMPATRVNAAEQPRRFGDGFGINIKVERITWPELDQIAALGFRRVRLGISWFEVEKEKSVYRFDYAVPRDPAAPDYPESYVFNHDAMVAAIRERGLHLDVTLNQGNTLYTGEPVNIAPSGQPPSLRLRAPSTQESRAGFAAFAAATVKYFQEKHGSAYFTWLIWNEPDFPGGWPPETNAAEFSQLLHDTCTAIRAAVPTAIIMGPALGAHGNGDIKVDFIKGLFTTANPLPCLDAFTIHPYRAYAPETATKTYAEVARLLAPWQPKDKPPVPLAVDEWGYSINRHRGEIPEPARWRNYSGEEQAALMLRMYLTNLAAGLPLTTIYDWRDRGTDPFEWEDHFGVIGFKGEEKPALKMFRVTWPLLLDRPLQAPVPLPHCPPTLHALRFGPHTDDAKNWLILWTETEVHTLTLKGEPEKAQNIFGEVVKWQRGSNNIEVKPQPMLLAEHPSRLLSLSCSGNTKTP